MPRAVTRGSPARRCREKATWRATSRGSTTPTPCRASSCRTSSRSTPWVTLSGSARVGSPQRVRHVCQPAPVAADASVAEWTMRVSGGPRLLRADAVHGRHRSDRAHAGRAAGRRSRPNAPTACRPTSRGRAGRSRSPATVFYSRIDGALGGSRDRPRRLPDRRSSTSTARPGRAAPSSSRAAMSRASTSSSRTCICGPRSRRPTAAAGARRRSTRAIPRPSTCCVRSGPARIGFEVFYTGRQSLDDNPYRTAGFAHVLFGGLVDWGIGALAGLRQRGESRRRPADAREPARTARRATWTGDGRWTRGRPSMAGHSTPACVGVFDFGSDSPFPVPARDIGCAVTAQNPRLFFSCKFVRPPATALRAAVYARRTAS